MKFIQFGKFNKKLLIPILGGIFMLFTRLILRINPAYENAKKNPFIINIYVSTGMILSFIPYLILKHKNKVFDRSNSNRSQIKSKLDLELIHSRTSEKINFTKYKLILFSEIFDFSQVLLTSFNSISPLFYFWTFDPLFICLFSCLILKTNLYKHQYVSIFIIIIFGFVLNLLEYFKLDDKNYQLDTVEILLSIFSEICLSLSMVIVKYNMEKTFCSPYEICIWEGALALIFNIIILIVLNELELTISGNKYPENLYNLFSDYDIYDILLCLTMVFGQGIYNMVLFSTCDYFTPYHIVIILIIVELYNSWKILENKALNISSLIILVLIAFIYLFFIEIIELNICNISFNTKKNIERRSLTESLIGASIINNLSKEVSVDIKDTNESEQSSEPSDSSFSNNSDTQSL